VLATLLTQRGQYFKDTGRYGQAAEDLSRCRETWMRLMADFPGRPQYRQDLARDTVLHAIVLRRIEDFDRADASFAEAIAIQRALAAEFPATPDYEAALAGQQMNYASLLMEVDRAQEAEVYFRQAVDVFVGLATRQPILSHQAEASAALHNFGRLLLTRGELSEARTCFERAIGFRRPCVDLLPESAMHREALRNHYWSLCAALARLTDHAATVLAAEELPRCLPRSADECLRAAQYVARCIPYAQSDAALSEVERASTGARYADRAMELLRQGAALGTPRFDVLRDDRDLAPLRERADFQVLLTTARR
jgi:tetratricopeptide (TPR) repeat protein